MRLARRVPQARTELAAQSDRRVWWARQVQTELTAQSDLKVQRDLPVQLVPPARLGQLVLPVLPAPPALLDRTM